jgi:hypothetical protein
MSTKKISINEFMKSIEKFRATEKGGSLYDMAINLINNSFRTEAYILILATWNSGHFRFVGHFRINEFERQIKTLQPLINKMKSETIKYINVDKHATDIDAIYTTLSQIKGVKYTGASKIMHLLNPQLFIMWDNYIRGKRARRYYRNLYIVKKGYWCPERHRYGDDAKHYIRFLQDMQNFFGHLNYEDSRRTFAKAIDEYNYYNISDPIRNMEKAERDQKRR